MPSEKRFHSRKIRIQPVGAKGGTSFYSHQGSREAYGTTNFYFTFVQPYFGIVISWPSVMVIRMGLPVAFHAMWPLTP